MRCAVDLRHPLQAPCGGYGRVEGARKERYIQSSRPWECGNPEGISKECGKGGKPASWLSTLSILCHFHGLLFTRQMLGDPDGITKRTSELFRVVMRSTVLSGSFGGLSC